MSLPVPGGREAVSLFEVTHEVTFVGHADLRHHLFDAEVRGPQKLPGALHPEQAQVLCGGQARFLFEELV
jgi:hypothetical protein